MNTPEMEQKIQKKFFVIKIIAFVSRAPSSHNLKQDTCPRQLMSWQKHKILHVNKGDISFISSSQSDEKIW